MTQSLSTITPAIILALGGIMLIWWWTSRPTISGGLRTVVRLVAIPLFIGLAAGAVFLLNGSATAVAAETPAVIVPSEMMTAQTGTLTVTLNATGALTAADDEILTFDTVAPVTEVLVAVGDTVKAGDVLAQIDTTTLDTQVFNAQLAVAEAQNALAALQEPPTEIEIELAESQVQAAQASLSSASLNGPTEQDIAIAALNVEQAKNSLWQAQVNRDVSESRPGAGQELNAYSNDVKQAAQLEQSDMSITAAQNNYEALLEEGPDASGLASGNASLISAQANLDSLLAGPSATDIRQSEIQVETAQLALDAAQKSLEQATLVAPFEGIVASVDFIEGTLSSSGSITLINTNSYTITLSVDEKDITQLALGQAVSLRMQALDDTTIPGNVTQIALSPATSESSQLVTYNVEVTLGQSDAVLRPGMSAIATVTLNQVDGVIVVPNRFITVDATTQQATVKIQSAPATYEDIPVTLGTRTDSESAVIGGLNVGQTLVILPSASDAAAQGGFGLIPGGGGAFPGGGGGGGFPGGRPGG